MRVLSSPIGIVTLVTAPVGVVFLAFGVMAFYIGVQGESYVREPDVASHSYRSTSHERIKQLESARLVGRWESRVSLSPEKFRERMTSDGLSAAEIDTALRKWEQDIRQTPCTMWVEFKADGELAVGIANHPFIENRQGTSQWEVAEVQGTSVTLTTMRNDGTLGNDQLTFVDNDSIQLNLFDSDTDYLVYSDFKRVNPSEDLATN